MRSILIGICLVTAACSAAAGVIPFDDHAWSRLTPPRAPFGAVSTYDPSHDRAILLPTAFSPAGETWQSFFAGRGPWDRTAPSPVAPDPGSIRGAIYDLRHGLIVFARRPEDGAPGAGSLGVWVVGSKGVGAWSRVAVDGDSPADRVGFAVVSDTRRDRLLLFGGGPQSDLAIFADTWTLDMTSTPWRWHRLSLVADPPPRSGMACAYDSLGDRFVVCGGAKQFPDGSGVSGTNEVWSLSMGSGASWDSLGAAGAIPVDSHVAALAVVPGTSDLLLCQRAYDHVELWKLQLAGDVDARKLAAGERALSLPETAALAPGVYFARVRLAGRAETATAKFVVLR